MQAPASQRAVWRYQNTAEHFICTRCALCVAAALIRTVMYVKNEIVEWRFYDVVNRLSDWRPPHGPQHGLGAATVLAAHVMAGRQGPKQQPSTAAPSAM
jgi:hypothetical protein